MIAVKLFRKAKNERAMSAIPKRSYRRGEQIPERAYSVKHRKHSDSAALFSFGVQ